MSKPKEPTYAELERSLRLDLAVRVVSDPEAPSEHVEAAKRFLQSEQTELTYLDLVGLDRRVMDVVRCMLGNEQTDPTMDPEVRDRVRRVALAALYNE